jgi:hypothetical protein
MTAKVYRWNRPGPTGTALRVLLLITGVSTLLLDVAAFLYLRRHVFVIDLPDPQSPATFVPPAWMNNPSAVLWLPSLFSQATMVVWLIWQHQATANLWARRYPNLRTTPGWAVGWWFIPFANFGMPLVAMLEVDRRSTPDGLPRKSSPLLGWWWAAWLGGSLVVLVGVLVSVMPTAVDWAQTIDEQATTLDLTPLTRAIAPWILVSGMFQCAAAVLAAMVVRRIDRAQSAMAADAATVPSRPDLPLAW